MAPPPQGIWGLSERELTGLAGYGAPENRNQPKRYVFRYAANGRDLDLRGKQ